MKFAGKTRDPVSARFPTDGKVRCFPTKTVLSRGEPAGPSGRTAHPAHPARFRARPRRRRTIARGRARGRERSERVWWGRCRSRSPRRGKRAGRGGAWGAEGFGNPLRVPIAIGARSGPESACAGRGWRFECPPPGSPFPPAPGSPRRCDPSRSRRSRSQPRGPATHSGR